MLYYAAMISFNLFAAKARFWTRNHNPLGDNSLIQWMVEWMENVMFNCVVVFLGAIEFIDALILDTFNLLLYLFAIEIS